MKINERMFLNAKLMQGFYFVSLCLVDTVHCILMRLAAVHSPWWFNQTIIIHNARIDLMSFIVHKSYTDSAETAARTMLTCD